MGGCGNRNCRVSTGIDEILTFGRGELDNFGFWSIPCGPCARAAEQFAGVPAGSYWPHTKEWLEAQKVHLVEVPPTVEQLARQEVEELIPDEDEMEEMAAYFHRPAAPVEEVDESKLPF